MQAVATVMEAPLVPNSLSSFCAPEVAVALGALLEGGGGETEGEGGWGNEGEEGEEGVEREEGGV